MLITHHGTAGAVYLNLDRMEKRETPTFPTVYLVSEGLVRKGRVLWSAKHGHWRIHVEGAARRETETFKDVVRAALAVRRLYRPSVVQAQQLATIALVSKRAVRR